MSSASKASQQHLTTSCSPEMVASLRLPSARGVKSPSHRPELVGKQFGMVKVISPNIIRKGGTYTHRYLLVECVRCGKRKEVSYDNLMRGKSKGCQPCTTSEDVIYHWLRKRMAAAKFRCTDPKSKQWMRYGGRGIGFEFTSVRAAVEWIMGNIVVPDSPTPDLDIGRVDNNRGYAPGNLRFVSRHENNVNKEHTPKVSVAGSRQAPIPHAMHLFREAYPEVRYADHTLKRLLRTLTAEEIAHRFFTLPSCKPKGKYGTFLTPDPETVLRYQEN